VFPSSFWAKPHQKLCATGHDSRCLLELWCRRAGALLHHQSSTTTSPESPGTVHHPILGIILGAWTMWATVVDFVHESMDIFYAVFNKKIICSFWKMAGALQFCRKAPIVYFIYDLVPTILQKQPWTFLKLYFRPCNFTFRSLYKIFNYN
jgi:hypothetical protein